MRRRLSWLFAVLTFATIASAQTYPSYTETYVNDFANVLTADEAERVRDKLKELKEKRDIEFTVVTIQTMADYGHSGPIEPFATGLFNYWGVGDATRNDGVMMLVALYDRQMRIEVGSGYGATKNAPMQDIIDEVILPKFRSDAYAEGIERGVDAVIHDLTGYWPGEYDATAVQRGVNGLKRFIDWLGYWLYLLLAPIVAFAARALRRWSRNRPRHCPIDGTEMIRLSEEWDDRHLQQGQITEERLKSVDYDVWECPKCDHVTIEGYKAWITPYGACRSCGFRTVEGETTVISSATRSSTGLKRIDYHCHNCGDEWFAERIIPKISSSSSSSGGSFSGGSSSGGGASGSW